MKTLPDRIGRRASMIFSRPPRVYWEDMVKALRQRVTVKPGGLVELRSDELQPGTTAEVIVLVETQRDPATLSSFIGSAPGTFSGPEEADAFVRSERDAWDR